MFVLYDQKRLLRKRILAIRFLLHVMEEIMEDSKREVLDMRDSNISRLNVTKGEDLAELYIQNNQITQLDLTANTKLEILQCDGNPLKYINATAPGSDGRTPLSLEAGRGGFVSLELAPGLQCYKAHPAEGFEFDGWYDELGDRLSKEQNWNDTYGAGRVLVAWFRAI